MSRVLGVEELTGKLAELYLQVLPSAQAAAANRVANTVKSRAARDIAAATGLRVSSVRRRIIFRKRATKNDPRAMLEISGGPLNLVEFVSGNRIEPRSPRIGITAKPWGKRRKFPGVFLARMPNGRVIAVKRSAAGKAGKKIRRGKWAGKSPHIEAVFGPGIAREAAKPLLAKARQDTVKERMEIELRHEVAFRMAKLLARGK